MWKRLLLKPVGSVPAPVAGIECCGVEVAVVVVGDILANRLKVIATGCVGIDQSSRISLVVALPVIVPRSRSVVLEPCRWQRIVLHRFLPLANRGEEA
jgi:hypothetical protein